MIKRFAVIALIILSAVARPFAQPANRTPAVLNLAGERLNKKVRFEHLTIEDGLSQGLVWKIYQDRRGFMWFGTRDGLNRYDGYRFTVFRHDPFDSTSLSDNDITAIYEDRAGGLWVGTGSNGLNYFDPATEKFRRFEHAADNPNSLSDNNVTAIGESAAGVIWIGTYAGGLNALVLVNGEYHFIRYAHDPRNAAALSSNTVYDVLADPFGTLWVATETGLNRLDSLADIDRSLKFAGILPNPALKRPVNHSGKALFTRYVHQEENRQSILNNECHSLAVSRDSTLWVGTSAGLARLNPQARASGRFVNYPHPPREFQLAWEVALNDMSEDGNGKLWLATATGLGIFDPRTEKYQYIRHNAQDPSSLSLDGICSVFCDRSGVMWVGTAGFGLNKYDPRVEQFHHYSSEDIDPSSQSSLSVSVLLEDSASRSKTWIFANEDCYQFDRAGGVSKRHPQDFSRFEAKAILEDRAGDIWITNRQALYRYGVVPQGGSRLKKTFPPPNQPGVSLYALYEDGTGDIWIGGGISEPRQKEDAVPNIHFYRWNRQTEKVQPYPMSLPETVEGYSLEIRRLHRDQKGVFWMATNQGLLRFDPETGAVRVYRNDPQNPASLSQNRLKTLLADPLAPSRYLWLGTDGGGLNRFDFAAETFVQYTEKQGLPNNVIYGILADREGNLWMSTNRGLSKAVLAAAAGDIVRFRNFDATDGLQSDEFNTDSYFKSKHGEMFFGGVKGFNVFYPEAIQDNPHVPPVIITDFQIHYQSVRPGRPGSPLQKSISVTEEILLSHENNALAFEFAGLDFSAPQKNLYSWKLENFDRDWRKPSRSRRAVYTNLDPGEYVFRVKASNNHGVWNEEGTSIKIVIMPPWWRTWWAYTLYVALVGGILYGLRRYEITRQQLKHQVEIEHLQAEKEHFEADKLKELDRLKSRFFANLSHEFRTPLTLVLGEIESVLPEQQTEPAQRKLERAFRNAKRLLRLINQLLDLSKLEAGSMKLNARLGNILPLLKNVTFSFESLARQKNITLHFESAEDEITIMYEADKLEKIIRPQRNRL